MSARVPVVRRQLSRDAVTFGVSVAVVAGAIALVLLLAGLRTGIGQGATLYVDHGPAVFVGQKGTTNFLSQVTVVPQSLGSRIARVDGVASVAPISEQYAMLRLHGTRVLALLVGYEPGRSGGPWKLASGHNPRVDGDVVVDRVLARNHDIDVGSKLDYRGASLRVVGLSDHTAGFMMPLMFTTRTTANMLSRRPNTASFFLVNPSRGAPPLEVARRISTEIAGVSALQRSELRDNDRTLFASAFNGPVLAMVAIAFIVALIVIATTVFSMVVARRREYATLKAIGIGRLALVRNVLAYSVLLAAAGAVIGIGAGFGAAAFINVQWPRYIVSISPSTVLLTGSASLVVGLVAALLPVRRLLALDPVGAFGR